MIKRMSSWLVLLDIDGTLCTRVAKKGKFKHEMPNKPYDYSSKYHRVWFRPFVKDLINNLIKEDFKVGTWTSATEVHAQPLLDKLLGEYENKLTVKAFRECCSKDINGDKPWTTVKKTSEFIKHFMEYKGDNIIVIDDTKDKLRYNNPELSLIIETYSINNKNIDYDNDTTLKDIIPKIISIRDKYNEIDNITNDIENIKITTE